VDDEVVVDACRRLDAFGRAIARKILRKFDLEFDSHRIEDIGQSLLWEGYKVWRDTGGDIELAKGVAGDSRVFLESRRRHGGPLLVSSPRDPGRNSSGSRPCGLRAAREPRQLMWYDSGYHRPPR
jgi:hypothetical protein